MKKGMVTLFAFVLSLAFAGIASAHVVVGPNSVPAGSYQVFTIRIPSESKDVLTTQVKLDIPGGVDVSRFEAKPDWTFETVKDADGKITSVTWKAAGKGMPETEFAQFNFQGKVAADATEIAWKAHQTYSDGSIVDWTGAPDADKPASVTHVTAAVAEGDSHGTTASADTNGNRDTLTLSLAIAGLVAGVLALIVSLVRRGSKA